MTDPALEHDQARLEMERLRIEVQWWRATYPEDADEALRVTLASCRALGVSPDEVREA